ncbi:MAG: hypothetical protein ACR2PG_15900 [Hyphomicrobiaceae bacterium]
MQYARLTIATLITLAGFSVGAIQADAFGRRHDKISRDGFVVAHSDFGNGSIVGPVRETRLGPQVRLPSGRWVYCKRLCSETLRVNTVDFWEIDPARRARGLTGEAGIFGKLQRNFSW